METNYLSKTVRELVQQILAQGESYEQNTTLQAIAEFASIAEMMASYEPNVPAPTVQAGYWIVKDEQVSRRASKKNHVYYLLYFDIRTRGYVDNYKAKIIAAVYEFVSKHNRQMYYTNDYVGVLISQH